MDKKPRKSLLLRRFDSNPQDYEGLDVSAGGVVVNKIEGEWKIALQTIPKDEEDEWWCLPKGRVEEGRGLEKTARREIYEEVGISSEDLSKERYLGQVERSSRTYNVWKEIHYFLFFTKQKDLQPAEDKHEGKWFDINQEKLSTVEEQNEIIRYAGVFLDLN
ncbi:MAG: NUDIX domain-containing protein [Candidatus Magasanikbacteria bacterium]